MIDVELWRMLAAYGFVVLVLFIFQWRGIARKTQLIVATLRMTIQLMIAGYVLAYIFEHPHPLVVVG
ncbi:MAG TPA: ABC transporter permease, partial [Savagea sp.]